MVLPEQRLRELWDLQTRVTVSPRVWIFHKCQDTWQDTWQRLALLQAIGDSADLFHSVWRLGEAISNTGYLCSGKLRALDSPSRPQGNPCARLDKSAAD